MIMHRVCVKLLWLRLQWKNDLHNGFTIKMKNAHDDGRSDEIFT